MKKTGKTGVSVVNGGSMIQSAVLKKVGKRVVAKGGSNVSKKVTARAQKKIQLTTTDQKKGIKETFALLAENLRPKLEIALLSPYRYPIDSQKVAIGVARYSGVLFVILGAITTLFFSSSIALNASSQYAMIASSLSQPLSPTGATSTLQIDCTDPLQYGSPACEHRVNKTPPAIFEVQGQRDSLRGSVRVEVKVPFAKKVKILLQNKQTLEEHSMGYATEKNPETWEFYIDTALLNDNPYILRAYVANAYGTYPVYDPGLFTIENHPLIISGSATVNSSTTASGSANLINTLVPELSVNVGAHDTEFRFLVKAVDVDSIKLYATEQASGKRTFLGSAYNSTSNEWKHRWIAKDFAEGTYMVEAQAIDDGLSFHSNTVRVEKIPSKGTATSSVLITPQPLVQELEPEVDIDIQSNVPLQGKVGLRIDVEAATAVEISAQRKGELIKRHLGQAKAVDKDTWIYFVETSNLPNGEHLFSVRVTNAFGSYEADTSYVKIANQIAVATPTEVEKIETLNNISNEPSLAPRLLGEPVSTTIITNEQDSVEIEKPKFEDDLKQKLDEELRLLTLAKRVGNIEEINRIEDRLRSLQSEGSGEQDKAHERIVSYVEEARKEVERRIEATNSLILERTKEKASEDSDGDGITDYDEVALFKTNPFLADSDSDGFVDGAEILGGYDPTDSANETLIAYESPKETGIERDDVLLVTSIATLKKEVNEKPEALISGTALPNSFITLYIFSTPVVVTVKTEADGSWTYRFDKELDDGEHEVYVGITDNAGKIVAKSKPFTFVKEAQAFTGKTEGGAVVQNNGSVSVPATSFLSQYMIYLVLSISVVAIGLVLILLGLHLDARARKETEGEEQKVKIA